VKDKLLDLFSWTEGHAALYRDVERPERAFPLRLDPWDVFVSGASRQIDAGLAEGSFAGPERQVLERTGFEIERVTLPDRLGWIWTACQAPRSLRELEGLGASAREARAGALVLLELGALRWRGRG
jgi:hypothetical protein